MAIELDSTLAQAEVLFLSFSQLIADVDRRQAEDASSRAAPALRRRNGSISALTADTQAAKRPIVSEELRELLTAGQ